MNKLTYFNKKERLKSRSTGLHGRLRTPPLRSDLYSEIQLADRPRSVLFGPSEISSNTDNTALVIYIYIK